MRIHNGSDKPWTVRSWRGGAEATIQPGEAFVREELYVEAVEALRECLKQMDVKVTRMSQDPDIRRTEVAVEREHPLRLQVEAVLAKVPAPRAEGPTAEAGYQSLLRETAGGALGRDQGGDRPMSEAPRKIVAGQYGLHPYWCLDGDSTQRMVKDATFYIREEGIVDKMAEVIRTALDDRAVEGHWEGYHPEWEKAATEALAAYEEATRDG